MRFLWQMGVTAYAQEVVLVYRDSTLALAYTKDPKYHGKSKHKDTRNHFFRNKVANGEVVLKHISTSNMLADPMTKPIIRNSFLTHVKNIGLCRVWCVFLCIWHYYWIKRHWIFSVHIYLFLKWLFTHLYKCHQERICFSHERFSLALR